MNFRLETILSLITGVAFEPGLNHMKALVEHMTGEQADEITFAIGARPKICKQEILKQYPQLKPFSVMENINRDNYQDVLWLAIETMGDNELFISRIKNMPTPDEYYSMLRQS